MSIDYDRLRELADEHTPGPWLCERDGDEYEFVIGTEDFGIITEADDEVDGHLIALAPDMARELLRLRRVLTETRDRIAGELERIGPELQAAHVTLYAERKHFHDFCNRLLDGGTE